MTLTQSDPKSLLEILQSGACASTERLTKLSGQKWNVHIISADAGSGKKFLSILARDQEDYYGVSLSTVGEKYLAIFSRESCRAIAGAFLNRLSAKPPAYEETDAVAEIANILVNSIVGAISDFQGSMRMVSAPTTVWGRKAELFSRAFGAAPSASEDVTSVLIHISSPSLSSDCTLLIQLDRLSVLFLVNPPPEF